jgi:hypothetical protein
VPVVWPARIKKGGNPKISQRQAIEQKFVTLLEGINIPFLDLFQVLDSATTD